MKDRLTGKSKGKGWKTLSPWNILLCQPRRSTTLRFRLSRRISEGRGWRNHASRGLAFAAGVAARAARRGGREWPAGLNEISHSQLIREILPWNEFYDSSWWSSRNRKNGPVSPTPLLARPVYFSSGHLFRAGSSPASLLSSYFANLFPRTLRLRGLHWHVVGWTSTRASEWQKIRCKLSIVIGVGPRMSTHLAEIRDLNVIKNIFYLTSKGGGEGFLFSRCWKILKAGEVARVDNEMPTFAFPVSQTSALNLSARKHRKQNCN